AAGYGSIFLPLKSQRAIRWNETKRAPRRLLDEDDLHSIRKCQCPSCVTSSRVQRRLALLRKDFHNRSLHNAWVISNQFRQWPATRRQMADVVGAGLLGPSWAIKPLASAS